MSTALQSQAAPSKRQREFKSWSASSGQNFSCAEIKQELSLSRTPSLGCVVCKGDIKCTPVYQRLQSSKDSEVGASRPRLMRNCPQAETPHVRPLDTCRKQAAKFFVIIQILLRTSSASMDSHELVTDFCKGDFCLVCASAAFGLQHELGEWTASSTNEQLAGEENPKFNFRADLMDLTCIVCKRDIFPPVLQCQNGHLACIDCSEKGVQCSACSRSISRIRNVALENIITSATVSCTYARMGCPEVCSFSSRDTHEKMCSFEPKMCTVPGCNQAGFENRFPEHLKCKHNVDMVLDLEDCTSEAGEYSLMATLCLDSFSNSKVLLTHQNGVDCYLLHQESTASGELLHITALEQSLKRKYQIAVEISDEQTYCYKSLSTATSQQPGRLLIPKQTGAPLENMFCRIRLE